MKVLKAAKKIVTTLRENGFTAYFAGGWVRDYLMGFSSSDIDVATDADPEEVLRLFPKTVPVGASFGVVIVVMQGSAFEVATFRKDLESNGRRPRGIVKASLEEDALRRDFTINGMYYDPIAEEVIDLVGGRQDLQRGVIRAIGPPLERFREDRLRMVRAVRFASRFGFVIEKQTEAAIVQEASFLFPAVSVERIWQELKKMAEYPGFASAFSQMHRLGLLSEIFPDFAVCDDKEIEGIAERLSRLPEKHPPILFLIPLLAEKGQGRLLQAARFFKVSNAERDLLLYAGRVREAVLEGRAEDAVWARLYADSRFEAALESVASFFAEPERSSLLDAHRKRGERLSLHVARIRAKTPLIRAEDLLQEGIAPGKEMGMLLLEAEKLSINENLDDKKSVLNALRRSSLWKSAKK